jgi:CheY-like chemotaxis protein
MSTYLLLDDSPDVLRIFAETFAREGTECRTLHHGEQTPEQLQTQVLALLQPQTVLLLDGQLSGGLYGWDILRLLREQKPDVRCIGFSSDPHYSKPFLQAGAMGFVQKRLGDPQWSVQRVRELAAG